MTDFFSKGFKDFNSVANFVSQCNEYIIIVIKIKTKRTNNRFNGIQTIKVIICAWYWEMSSKMSNKHWED